MRLFERVFERFVAVCLYKLLKEKIYVAFVQYAAKSLFFKVKGVFDLIAPRTFFEGNEQTGLFER